MCKFSELVAAQYGNDIFSEIFHNKQLMRQHSFAVDKVIYVNVLRASFVEFSIFDYIFITIYSQFTVYSPRSPVQ